MFFKIECFFCLAPEQSAFSGRTVCGSRPRICYKFLEHSGYHKYHLFKHYELTHFSTQYIHVFGIILTTKSNYIPHPHSMVCLCSQDAVCLSVMLDLHYYLYTGGADKSLGRPGRKQANVSVRMA